MRIRALFVYVRRGGSNPGGSTAALGKNNLDTGALRRNAAVTGVLRRNAAVTGALRKNAAVTGVLRKEMHDTAAPSLLVFTMLYTNKKPVEQLFQNGDLLGW